MSPGIQIRSDLTGRVLGILVFLLGVGLLVAVFCMAYKLFNESPAVALGVKFTGDPKKDPTVAAIGTQFGALIYRVALLLIMSVAGSLVAQFGVKLYFSAMKGHTPEVLSHHVTNPEPLPPSP